MKLFNNHKNQIKIGIQGGIGSFNEQAVNKFINNNDISNYKIVYLYTTENVLNSLQNGEIYLGQFAIHNAIGGMVTESIHAMAKYTFEIVDEFAILISHHLMKRKDVDFIDIDTIMAHDQVLKQCKKTLLKKYSEFKLVTGKGDLIDTANAAKALSEGLISNNIAILGPKILSDIYGFDVVDSNLQDMKKNYTSFLIVKKRC